MPLVGSSWGTRFVALTPKSNVSAKKLVMELGRIFQIISIILLMTNLTITLPDNQLEKLKQKAVFLGISPEELVLLSIQELIDRSDDDFKQATDYILNKNSELYRRLA